MLRFAMTCALLSGLSACQPSPGDSKQRTQTTEAAAPATNDNAESTKEPAKPIHLPSQNQQPRKGYPMPGVRPSEICMEKGFTYLYQGYLRPECGTCHNKDNRYGVTQFAQGADEAASLVVLKTLTDSKKLLEAVLGNVFCKGCIITKDDPLYADLEYFTTHMDRCDKPN